MSMPEMPAKEVTPEFGFREASPSVAAAALAALKGGTTDGRRTRGGVGRRTSQAAASATPLAPAEQPPGEQVAVPIEGTAETEELARRRRRRRGGRGRGRGRREEGAAPVAGEGTEAPAEGAIGWEEFDDLSQLDLGEEREYTFEEADAATLAELGLSPDDVSAEAADAPDADAASPTEAAPARATRARSPRARKPAAEADTAPADGEPAKPRRRSPRAPAGADAKSGATPRRRGTRAGKADGDDASGAADKAEAPEGTSRSSADASGEQTEPEGIWGRFRSARRPRTAG
jgi:hypothetical protein